MGAEPPVRATRGCPCSGGSGSGEAGSGDLDVSFSQVLQVIHEMMLPAITKAITQSSPPFYDYYKGKQQR